MSTKNQELNENEVQHGNLANDRRRGGRPEHSIAMDNNNNNTNEDDEQNQHKGLSGKVVGVVGAAAGKLHQGYNAVKNVVIGAAHVVTDKAYAVTGKAKAWVGMGNQGEQDTSTTSSENEQGDMIGKKSHKTRSDPRGLKPRKAKYHKNDNDHNNHIKLPGMENEEEINHSRHHRRGEQVSITDHNMFEPLNHAAVGAKDSNEITVGGRH